MKKRGMMFGSLMLVLCAGAYAQSVDEIKENPAYLYGEGAGRTLRAADNDALQSLISKISVSVESDFSQVEEEIVTDGDIDATSAVTSVIKTYSQATLQNTERIVVKEEPDAIVFRYVKRSDVDRIFDARKTKLIDMVASAQKAESKGKIDDALRYYYWSYCLLQSVPGSNAVTDAGHILINWIPEQINEILDDVKFIRGNVDDNYVEIQVLYKDKPVTSLDYTYFDGMNWSNLYSARDGRGVLEMRPGASTDNLRVKCEYEYAGEAHIDKEISQVVEVMRGRIFRNATINVQTDYVPLADVVQANTAVNTNAGAVLPTDIAAFVPPRSELSLLSDQEAAPYRESMNKLIDAIRSGGYNKADELFTEDGLEIFNKLVTYGKGRIVGTPELTFVSCNDEVICRSLPMNFSFSNNNRQFVENISFTFNADRKIDCMAFGLDEKATDDILHHAAWSEYARKILTEFLENYKTAYSLKRIDYLRQVFDDNAVIITGKVVTRPEQVGEDNQRYINNKYVQLTRQSKEQYLKNLERCFDSNEFINIRFAENDIVKAGVGGEVYGIQIRQDYYSSNYGDTGYLFLMVDLNNPRLPVIKVRVWQPERDPDFQGLPNF